MEQYIDYSVVSESPAMLGMVYICAWCNRVKEPGADPQKPNSWKVVEQQGSLGPRIFLSHGICPVCKAGVA